MSNQLIIEYIKSLVPLCDIKKEENLRDLYKNILLGKKPAGETLFHSGHNNEFTYYLLSGELTLIDSGGNKTLLHSEDRHCKFPIGYDQSHKYTVITNTNINYLKINSQALDVLLTWDQTTTPLIQRPHRPDEDIEQVNWMAKILEMELFQRIPPVNIQAMFLRFEEISAAAGDTIIEQDSEADYYYVIKSGRCSVIRTEAGPNAGQLTLAELGPGEAFGEEALVADSRRNASIVMQEAGVLARLAKADFVELLKNPVMKSLSYPEALDLIAKGARFIDARTANEHRHNHLANSLNIPLDILRDQLDQLDNNLVYIVYCDTGSRSAAASYILNQRGFVAYLLDQGLNHISSAAIIHPDKN